jgi:hypothetical protein
MDEQRKKGRSRRRTDSMASCSALQLACSRSDASWSGSCVVHICAGVILYGICLKLYPSAVENITYHLNIRMAFTFRYFSFITKSKAYGIHMLLLYAFGFKMLSINTRVLSLKSGKIERKMYFEVFLSKNELT